MKWAGISKEDAGDRVKWKWWTRVVNSKLLGEAREKNST